MKTRDRILLYSLELFNRFGHVKVSTVDIANELDISPGNLYYHFNGKDELLLELFNEYEAALNRVINLYNEDVEKFEDYWAYLHVYLGLIQRYSFFYRDVKVLFSVNSLFKRRFTRMLDRHLSFFKMMLTALNQTENIQISEAQADMLSESMTLVATNSLFNQMDEGEYDDKRFVRLSVCRLISLVEPYFTMPTKLKYEVELQELISV
jgi:AcrR family transcriptional regulator